MTKEHKSLWKQSYFYVFDLFQLVSQSNNTGGRPPYLSVSVCVYEFAAPSSNPIRNIYAYLICNWIAVWKEQKQTWKGAGIGPFF